MNEILNETLNKNHELIRRLRAVADFFETHPVPSGYTSFYSGIYLKDKEDLLATTRGLGHLRKEADADSKFFKLTKDFGGDISVSFIVDRDEVCERVVTTKVIPARPEIILPATPEREEEVISWKCPDSLLSRGIAEPVRQVPPRSLGEEYGDPKIDEFLADFDARR